MESIVIKDLEMNQELGKESLHKVYGGHRRIGCSFANGMRRRQWLMLQRRLRLFKRCKEVFNRRKKRS